MTINLSFPPTKLLMAAFSKLLHKENYSRTSITQHNTSNTLATTE